MKIKIFTPPYRVGKKQNRSVLDSNGNALVVFPTGCEKNAEDYCNYLNSQLSRLPQPIDAMEFSKWKDERYTLVTTEKGYLRNDEYSAFLEYSFHPNPPTYITLDQLRDKYLEEKFEEWKVKEGCAICGINFGTNEKLYRKNKSVETFTDSDLRTLYENQLTQKEIR